LDQAKVDCINEDLKKLKGLEISVGESFKKDAKPRK
jgi:hypothetical protein